MISLTVKSIASYPAIGLQEEKTILDGVNLMNEKGIGAIIIYSGEEAIGIVTERNIMLNFEKDNTTALSEIMSSPIVSINENESIGKAAQLLLSKSIRRLGVTNDEDKFVGFINMRDILRSVHESFLGIFEVASSKN